MKTEHYVTFYYPGSFLEESESFKIQEYSISCALQMLDNRAYAFILWDKVTQNATREDGKVMQIEDRTNESEKYYPGGKFYTVEDVLSKFGPNSILYSNTKNNHSDGVIETRWGNFQPFTNMTKIIKDNK